MSPYHHGKTKLKYVYDTPQYNYLQRDANGV